MIIGIVIGCIIGIFILLFIFAFILHNKAFKNRFEVDPFIKYYTQEEFNLKSLDANIKCGKENLKGKLYFYDNYIENKIVIFAHGMWSSTKAYMQDIEYLCKNGYRVLGFDYIGTDLSTGKGIKGLSNGLKSLDSAINYIKQNYPNHEIYVIGHSWGAFNTTNIISYHKDIKKIVAMAPFISIFTVLKGMLPKKLWFIIPFLVFVEYLKFGRYALLNSIRSLNKYNGKAMILHSKNDPMIKYENNTLKIQKKCKNKNIKCLIVDNKYHNPNYSDSAIKLLLEYTNRLKNTSKEESIEIKKNTDFHKLGELDCNIMECIIKFFKD